MTVGPGATRGLVPGIFPASVYRCDNPQQAEALLGGQEAGFAYQRDGHPNAELLAEKCRRLHDARWAVVTSTGMSAIAVATLTLLRAGQHVVVSEQLYGRTMQLLTQQWPRLGVEVAVVDTLDPDAVRGALRANTRLVVVETLTNPMLRITPLAELSDLVHATDARLLVDNTFATPVVCQPFRHGADYVVESISKMINGHSDVMLGLLCGRDDRLAEFRDTLSMWGMSSSPFDDWLACRGLSTLHLRMERASANAVEVAERLSSHAAVHRVVYPGRSDHPDWPIAKRILELGQGGSMVTFALNGGRDAVRQFMHAASQIPFCPSLGEMSTTCSHPASTSHRGLSVEQRADLGIDEGTIRLSIGTESAEWVWQSLRAGLDALTRTGRD